tara:strand:- start:213 stop:470 length:258 start_codon:yes stop_codon:yes gene_type:complete
MIEALLGAAVGSALTLLGVWVRNRKPYLQPLKGEKYFLDGRLVEVEDPRDNWVFIYTPTRQHQRISWRYWRRRARPAASNPGKLL